MDLSAKLLRLFTYAPPLGAVQLQSSEPPLAHALDQLKTEFKQLDALVRGKKLLDFGCGYGLQSIALAQTYRGEVIGLDINQKHLMRAQSLQQKHGAATLPLRFLDQLPEDEYGSVDVVLSQNAFEHFAEPEKMLQLMLSYLKPDGVLLISFGPPWLAPHGSHMSYFCRLPWVNVFFSERTVMRVRALYRHDGARYYHEIESGLNKMTVARFERIVKRLGLNIYYRHYTCIKRLNFLRHLPFFREFFINQISVCVRRN